MFKIDCMKNFVFLCSVTVFVGSFNFLSLANSLTQEIPETARQLWVAGVLYNDERSK